jgi:hypothetical protein
MDVPISTTALYLDPLPNTPTSSAIETPDDPSASLVEIEETPGTTPPKQKKGKEHKKGKERKEKETVGGLMLLNQQQIEISKWNTPLISCAAQV